VEWCVDTRVGGAVTRLEQEVTAHLARHAIEPAVAELARPLVHEALTEMDPGPIWVSFDWEEQLARLELRHLPAGDLPGESVGAGLTRAQDDARSLFSAHGSSPGVRVGLAVARAPEANLDPVSADPALVPAGQPAAVAALMAAHMTSGMAMDEAAALAGATVAQRRANEAPLAPDPMAVADSLIATEAELGGDFHVVSRSRSRVVLGVRRCPFGPSPPPGLCRFTSALAGGLGARAAGGAEVTLDERIALGDPQCRLVVDLGTPTGRLTSHRYAWPATGILPLDADESDSRANGFRFTLSLQLPRDRLSVPVTRHLIRAAMSEVGVLEEDSAAVELALTEACANVIDHSGPGDVYDVAVSVGPSDCHIRVIDVGHGFDHVALRPTMAAMDAEHGRGVALMHALVDHVRFESEPEKGTIVHLVKALRFDDGVPARKLMLEELAAGAGDG